MTKKQMFAKRRADWDTALSERRARDAALAGALKAGIECEVVRLPEAAA